MVFFYVKASVRPLPVARTCGMGSQHSPTEYVWSSGLPDQYAWR